MNGGSRLQEAPGETPDTGKTGGAGVPAPTSVPPSEAAKIRGSESPLSLASRRFRRHRSAMASLVILSILVTVAILAPVISPHDPNVVNAASFREPPSSAHWLGTDAAGRDVFSRLLHGSRVSLAVAGLAGALAAITGSILGLVAGLFGGWIDSVIMRIVDIVLAFPGLLVILLLAAFIGPSITTIVVVIALLGWPYPCRIVRQVSLSAKEMDYFLAARALGASRLQIIYRHLVASVLPPLTVVATLISANAILLEAALSFLGLGVRRPQATWGGMLSDAQSLTVLQQMPWLWIPPGLAIAVTVLAINLVGDGLRDAADPRQHL